MKKKLCLLSVLIVFAFSGCYNQSKEQVVTNNPAFDVEFLFEHDGCKVFRFYDGGHIHYYTTCQGSVTSVEDKSGNPEEISTIVKN